MQRPLKKMRRASSRRSSERGRDSGPSPVQRALEQLGTPSDVLRCHGVQVRGRVARCPFHEDRTPSLSVFKGRDGKERWKCHGCDVGGDALDLEVRLSGRSIREIAS